MAITFKYPLINRPKPYDPIRLPTIPITLFGNKGTSIDAVALIDSGADVTTLPKDIGELLELDLKSNKTEVRGIGGTLAAVNERITIKIGNAHETYRLRIPVMVPLTDSKTVPEILLGRAGIFNQFDIIFKERDAKIVFKKRTDIKVK